ncbi:MAG: hypothetical protein ACJAR9_001051 [Celeribacter sp.]|jgi:hypothetical protein
MNDGLTPLEKELLRCVETSLKRIEQLDERLKHFGEELKRLESTTKPPAS